MAKKTKLVEDTQAAETINPPEHASVDFGGGDGSHSRFNTIAKMIGQVSGMSDDHLTKFYKEMMASHDRQGHGEGVGDNSGSNKASIEAHASDAKGGHDMDTKMSADTIKHVAPGNTLSPKLAHEAFNTELKTAVAEMFSEEEGLTEEFKTKATVIFETAVNAKVALVAAEIEKSAEEALEGEVEQIQTALAEAIEAYLDHTATKWLEDNQVAVESSLRNEIMSEFAEGLRNLFIEHNFNIPEEQIEVVETLAAKVDELETQLNSAILENADLREFKEQVDKFTVVQEVSEGLTMVDAEKLATLAESVDADDVETFKNKLQIVKESTFSKPNKKVTLTEDLEDVDPNLLPDANEKPVSTEMKKYVDRIKKELANQ